jgi:hypothetical protein
MLSKHNQRWCCQSIFCCFMNLVMTNTSRNTVPAPTVTSLHLSLHAVKYSGSDVISAGTRPNIMASTSASGPPAGRQRLAWKGYTNIIYIGPTLISSPPDDDNQEGLVSEQNHSRLVLCGRMYPSCSFGNISAMPRNPEQTKFVFRNFERLMTKIRTGRPVSAKCKSIG